MKHFYCHVIVKIHCILKVIPSLSQSKVKRSKIKWAIITCYNLDLKQINLIFETGDNIKILMDFDKIVTLFEVQSTKVISSYEFLSPSSFMFLYQVNTYVNVLMT